MRLCSYIEAHVSVFGTVQVRLLRKIVNNLYWCVISSKILLLSCNEKDCLVQCWAIVLLNLKQYSAFCIAFMYSSFNFELIN